MFIYLLHLKDKLGNRNGKEYPSQVNPTYGNAIEDKLTSDGHWPYSKFIYIVVLF